MGKNRQTTKDKILTLLKKKTKLTVQQLSLELEITEMAVRKHLNMLDRDGLLKVVEKKQPIGRPVQYFSLSPEADKLFPKNYDNLTVDFLNDLEAMQGNEIIDRLFENRGKRLASKYDRFINKATSNNEKVEILKNIQADKGYMADVTQLNTTTFELIEHHCPIFEVAKQYKQACHCETKMFQEVLGTEKVQRVQCKADGASHCHFIIQFEEEELPVEI